MCITSYSDSTAEPVSIVEYGVNSYATPIVTVGCFPRTELVQLPSGLTIPIGLVKIGDKIKSWNVINKKNNFQFTRV